MTFVIIIFFLSIVLAFGMLLFKTYKIETNSGEILNNKNINIPNLPFRNLEKFLLYFIKYIIQAFIFVIARYWFTIKTKVKKWFIDKWPKINSYFKKQPDSTKPYRHSFFQKAILESKAKIKIIKDEVSEEIEEAKESEERKVID